MANFVKYLPQIESILENSILKVLTTIEFEGLVSQINNIQGIKSATRKQITEFLLDRYLSVDSLRGYTDYHFYFFKNTEFDQYDIASTRSRSAFFSHYSALSIHNLTIQIPKQIYLTWERKSLREPHDLFLFQEDVNLAFSKNPRITQDQRKYKNFTINFIRGQNNNYLGIKPFRKYYLVSDIERTLIDVSVRPFYAGGTTQVLQAFEASREIVDTNKLFDYYMQMNFIYPYHKVIGFYLDKAGYSSDSYSSFLNLESQVDFYLTYNILHKEFNSKWKIFIPRGF